MVTRSRRSFIRRRPGTEETLEASEISRVRGGLKRHSDDRLLLASLTIWLFPDANAKREAEQVDLVSAGVFFPRSRTPCQFPSESWRRLLPGRVLQSESRLPPAKPALAPPPSVHFIMFVRSVISKVSVRGDAMVVIQSLWDILTLYS